MAGIGFIGVGVMGAPMAANLVRGGHRLKVFDLSEDALAKAKAFGAEIAASKADAGRDVSVLITMLPTGAHVSDALLGEGGAADALGSDALVIDMSTIMPLETDAVGAALRERSLPLVDAPVGRSSKHAEEGKLLIMAGGEVADLDRAEPILQLMGDPVVRCGGPGSGSRAKIVNNYMSIACNVVTAESLALADKSGLDPAVALDIMCGTTAGQGHLSTTYPAKVLQSDVTPGFMIDLAHKDMGLALELAGRIGVPLTMGAVARQVYDVARTEGRGREDWSALYLTVRRLAGLDPI